MAYASQNAVAKYPVRIGYAGVSTGDQNPAPTATH